MTAAPRRFRGWLPRRRRDAHKGDAGHVLLAAGSRGMMGAARLCAWGALRGGVGLVTLALPGSERGGPPWEALTLPLPSAKGAFSAGAAKPFLKFASARAVGAVVAGPGFSRAPGAATFFLRAWRSFPGPLVADADALNALAGRPSRRKGPAVLTPHPGEAARLLRTSVARVQADRPAAARALAEKFGAVAVLKGAGTVVTDGRFFYRNGTGNPGMASGGMGDVLAGLLGALIPQVSADSPEERCLRAAVLAVWMHGRAGDLAARDLGPAGLAASDVAARIPRVFKELW
jgi:hydroxyethylthiazole kinase-like uncharacterized protein yjeF